MILSKNIEEAVAYIMWSSFLLEVSVYVMKDYEKAQADYLSGMKYKDIAAKYDVSLNTVKSWKSRYWNKGAPVKKSVHKKVAHKNASSSDDLNPQQEMFAQLVAGQRIPMYRAYQIAYKENHPTVANAYRRSSELAKNPKVAVKISEISKASAAKHDWSLDKVVESLTFLHDEAKADLIQNGLRKANADALLESGQELSKLLELDPSVKAQNDISKAKAEELSGTQESVTIAGDWKKALMAAAKKRSDQDG